MYRFISTLKKFILCLITILILTYFAKIKQYEYDQSAFLPNQHPMKIWEFLADFSNMKKLNPTITDFDIVSETGNYNRWRYTVSYKEHLSHWPYLENHSIGHYRVLSEPEIDHYFIQSNHTTCMFSNLLCLNSSSEIKLSRHFTRSGCDYQEVVTYQCPGLLSLFCQREVSFQRIAIAQNLNRIFSP